jgi:hypothetical protein
MRKVIIHKTVLLGIRAGFFPKYHMKILLGDFNTNVRRQNIFKPTIGNESLLQANNDNAVRIVHLATLKVQFLRTGFFGTETFISTPGSPLMGRLTTKLITC